MARTHADSTLKRFVDALDAATRASNYDRLHEFGWREPSRDNDGALHDWQAAFIASGSEYMQRALVCANQVGKNFCAAFEVACHLTGLYPPWWGGRRFSHAVEWTCAASTLKTVRDGQQIDLFGRMIPGESKLDGTGWVPRNKIGAYSFYGGNVKNCVDTCYIKHVSGGWSTLYQQAYEQKQKAFEGYKRDGGWFDEECPIDIFSEFLMRLFSKKGMYIGTRTPLDGMTEYIKAFAQPPEETSRIRKMMVATWDQAYHLSEEYKNAYLNSFPEHERETRSRGVIAAGEGLVYPVSEDFLLCKPFALPDHWPRIAGHDFGWDHPASTVWWAFDPDGAVNYIYDCYRIRKNDASQHAASINRRGKWIPVAWPHDGNNHEKGSGEQLAKTYREAGVNMLHESARFEGASGGTQSVSAGCYEILSAMREGRIKVFSPLIEWFEERRLYHRKDNKIVKLNDDIMDAMRTGWMMRRYAVAKPHNLDDRRRRKPRDYNPYEIIGG